QIDSWRWQDVPFYIRAGKCLPVTCTELVVRLRRPPTEYPRAGLASNHFRFRISPDNTIALGMNVMAPGEDVVGQAAEMIASEHPGPGEMDAYERVLGDAMAGDATLFAREDYVEEAWRIVDPMLKAATPVHEYEPKTWGPREVERLTPPGGWGDPRGGGGAGRESACVSASRPIAAASRSRMSWSRACGPQGTRSWTSERMRWPTATTTRTSWCRSRMRSSRLRSSGVSPSAGAAWGR